jgi:hypothetical protein
MERWRDGVYLEYFNIKMYKKEENIIYLFINFNNNRNIFKKKKRKE